MTCNKVARNQKFLRGAAKKLDGCRFMLEGCAEQVGGVRTPQKNSQNPPLLHGVPAGTRKKTIFDTYGPRNF